MARLHPKEKIDVPICDVCGGSDFRQESVAEVFHVGDRYMLVEDTPATVCAKCGEKTFDAAVAEGIRHRLHGDGKPERSMTLEVSAYHA